MASPSLKKAQSAIFILLTLLLLCSNASAAPLDPLTGWAVSLIKDLVKEFGENVLGWIGDRAAESINTIIVLFKAMILWNPDPYAVESLAKGIVNILVPVYVLAITILGIYLIFVSVSPSGRAQAKTMILKLIFSMVLVTVALEIYDILLTISYALAERMLAGANVEGTPLLGAIAFISGPTFFIFLSLGSLIVITAAISIGLRHFLVFLMAAIFPLTLFLYFFEYTKGIGSKLMQFTMMAIFTQAVEALILAVTVASLNASSDAPDAFAAYLCLFMALGGSLMLTLAPLMMMGVLQWIGGALAAVGSVVAFMPGMQFVGGAMVAAGGVAAGMGPGGLIAGGTMAGLGGAYSGSLPNLNDARRRNAQNEVETSIRQKNPGMSDAQVRQISEDAVNDSVAANDVGVMENRLRRDAGLDSGDIAALKNNLTDRGYMTQSGGRASWSDMSAVPRTERRWGAEWAGAINEDVSAFYEKKLMSIPSGAGGVGDQREARRMARQAVQDTIRSGGSFADLQTRIEADVTGRGGIWNPDDTDYMRNMNAKFQNEGHVDGAGNFNQQLRRAY